MAKDNVEGTRRPFETDDILPARGCSGATPVGQGLVQALRALMARAGCQRIDAERRALDRLEDQMEALARAAADFDLAGGTCLSARLWTSSAAFHDGTMQTVLCQAAQAGDPDAGRGFLILFATDAGSRALYRVRARPFPVDGGITGDFRAGGPYLALIECIIDPMGCLRASRASAQAVAGPGTFMPILEPLERDLLRLLLAAQAGIENQAGRFVIERRHSPEAWSHGIELTHERGDGTRLAGTVEVARGSVPAPGEASFTVTDSSFRDGSFVQWLTDRFT